MQKKIKKVITFSLLFIICGCADKTTNSYSTFNEFPSIVETKAVSVAFDTTDMSGALGMIGIVDDEIFFYENSFAIRNGLVKRFDLSTKKLIEQYGNKGNSGAEINRLGDVFIDDNKIKILDIGANKIVSFDVDNKHNVESKGFQSKYRVNGAALMEDDIIAFNPLIRSANSYSLVVEDGKGNILDSLKYDLDIDFTPSVKLDYDKKTKLLALGFGSGDLLYIKDYKTGTHRFIEGPYGKPDYTKASFPGGLFVYRPNHYGFMDVLIAGDKIYGLYSHLSFDEMAGNFTSKELRVYDLKGNPLTKYILDKGINNMAIDTKNNRLYGTYDKSRNNTIVYYNL